MVTEPFFHGARVRERDEFPLIARIPRTNTIGCLVTAPDADMSKITYNVPFMYNSDADLEMIKALGETGTAKSCFDDIRDQFAGAQEGFTIFFNVVEEGATYAETLSNMVGDVVDETGIHAFKKCESLFGKHLRPRIFTAKGYTHIEATDGIASINTTDGGTGYVNPTITLTGGGGNGAEAIAILQEGAIDEIVVTKPGYGYTSAPTVEIDDDTGVDAAASAVVGVTLNPLIAEMYSILEEMRSVAFVDGPDTSNQDALQMASKVDGGGRIYICDPKVLVRDTTIDANVPQFASARFAGVQARSDATHGYQRSLSNQRINGIVGVNRTINYPETTNLLNEVGVGTITHHRGGYRTWGNRTATSNKAWSFLSVRRAADFIYDGLEEAYMEFVDKEMNAVNVKLLTEGGNNFLRALTNERKILGGRCWFPTDLNSNEAMQQGQIKLGLDFEPVPPMENIEIHAFRNILYFDRLAESVLLELSSSPLPIAA